MERPTCEFCMNRSNANYCEVKECVVSLQGSCAEFDNPYFFEDGNEPLNFDCLKDAWSKEDEDEKLAVTTDGIVYQRPDDTRYLVPTERLSGDDFRDVELLCLMLIESGFDLKGSSADGWLE
ncbi:MAG: hypothetical protein FWF46_01990 [Oscillospiraceae bacterium]|nr:hypothetical protein [Oscillospiraceae bacterium]